MAVTAEASTSKYLPTVKVAERYGRTPRTIERWLDDEKLNFPQPVYINRFKYWNIDELETWERKRAAESAARESRVHTQLNCGQNATAGTSQSAEK
jgi:predicted DNA-binding transcriptional regulator AlpA